jgi:hypothetical protein
MSKNEMRNARSNQYQNILIHHQKNLKREKKKYISFDMKVFSADGGVVLGI